MEIAQYANATQLLQLGESVQISVMKTAELTAAEVSARVGLIVPVDAVIEAGVLAVLLVSVCVCCACRAVSRARAEAHNRKNDMIVAIARDAPEDDGDEHELEQHTHGRGATPGDSDLDDELCTNRAHAPASACG